MDRWSCMTTNIKELSASLGTSKPTTGEEDDVVLTHPLVHRSEPHPHGAARRTVLSARTAAGHKPV